MLRLPGHCSVVPCPRREAPARGEVKRKRTKTIASRRIASHRIATSTPLDLHPHFILSDSDRHPRAVHISRSCRLFAFITSHPSFSALCSLQASTHIEDDDLDKLPRHANDTDLPTYSVSSCLSCPASAA